MAAAAGALGYFISSSSLSSTLSSSSSSSVGVAAAAAVGLPIPRRISNGQVVLRSSFFSRATHSCFFNGGETAAALAPFFNESVASAGDVFERVVRIFKSYANAIVSSAEDPEKLLDQTVLEMNEDLTKLRQASAQVLASQRQLENKYKAAQQTANDWYRRAKALEKGEEDLARKALKRRKDYEDVEEELDEDELDALFEEHGEVVIADRNPRPASAEVDDDSQSLALAVALAEAANDMKAADIIVLHVKPLVYWTRFFVIATAFSRPQLAAIAKKMRDMGDERFKILPRGDTKPNSWTLLDYGDVVVHVFLPKERAFYNLEEFYGNATSVELPFKSAAAPSLG